MFRTVMETFLGLPKVMDFVSVALEISPKDYQKLSDFERFALVCENSDALLGSQIVKLFFYFLNALSDTKFTAAALRNRDEQKRAWRTIHGDNFANSGAILISKISSADYYKLHSCREYIDIVDFIFDRAKGTAQTLGEFIDGLYGLRINSFFISSEKA